MGDCSDAPVSKLSSYAIYQAKYLVAQLTRPDQYPIDYPVPAMTVFSLPKLGQVGVSTQTAKAQPNAYTIQTIDAATWQTYARLNQRPTQLKLVRRNSDQRIVGMTVLGDQADNLVNDFALLLNGKIDGPELQKMIFAYPAMADDLFCMWY
ncbi:glutathione reductase [Secundilactobacillus paracollinoides DSM 15502 = JCM 11969]|nr:glutathione reductase [Secundilactobacillus paracollinoides DSM 15502 = JCM 11969]